MEGELKNRRGSFNNSLYSEFSLNRVVNGCTTARDSNDLFNFNKNNLFNLNTGAMKFNVAAPPNGGSTNILLPSDQLINNQTTIQVNENQQDVVNQSSGVSIVNCYRAVPVQIVTSVDIVNCEDPSDQIVSSDLINSTNIVDKNMLDNRTYISTEAQTDDLQTATPIILSNVIQSPTEALISREQRRRERRERRQARTRSQHIHPAIPIIRPIGFEILPDILNSHLPPPYSTLPSTNSPPNPPPIPPLPPMIPTAIISSVPLGPVQDDIRYAFPLPVIRR